MPAWSWVQLNYSKQSVMLHIHVRLHLPVTNPARGSIQVPLFLTMWCCYTCMYVILHLLVTSSITLPAWGSIQFKYSKQCVMLHIHVLLNLLDTCNRSSSLEGSMKEQAMCYRMLHIHGILHLLDTCDSSSSPGSRIVWKGKQECEARWWIKAAALYGMNMIVL